MKSLIVIIFVFFISFLVNGQDYKPFDLENGEWYCRYSTKGGMFEVGHDTYYAIDSVKFFCSGDTLINDTLFKKLYYTGFTSSQIVIRTHISGYYGAIRNDTANKQVWFNDGNLSYPIYDFNINVGDSICNKVVYPLPVTFWLCGIVEFIDSVNYCGKYFKRYNIQGDKKIIEGIGSDKGLFPVFSSPWFSDFICYSEKGNSECNSCNINFTKIDKHLIDPNEINIYQTNDQIFISSNSIISSINLIDLSGRIIYRNDEINSINTNFHIDKKGIYIIEVIVSNDIINKKIYFK